MKSVQENDIERLTNNLSLNTTTGPCSIPTNILIKRCQRFNITSKDDHQIPSNYSPISILSVFSKLYEKYI